MGERDIGGLQRAAFDKQEDEYLVPQDYDYTAEGNSKKPVFVDVPAPVTVTVKNDQLIVKNQKGKQYKLQLIKRARKSGLPPAPSK